MSSASISSIFAPKAKNVQILISQESYHTMVLTICFQLFKKQTILWRYGGWKKKELHGNVPVFGMRHAFRVSYKMKWILRFLSEFFTFLSDNVFYKCSSLI